MINFNVLGRLDRVFMIYSHAVVYLQHQRLNGSIHQMVVFLGTVSTRLKKLVPKELACGGQASIATPLFDSSMSALPIIMKQNS